MNNNNLKGLLLIDNYAKKTNKTKTKTKTKQNKQKKTPMKV